MRGLAYGIFWCYLAGIVFYRANLSVLNGSPEIASGQQVVGVLIIALGISLMLRNAIK